MNRMCVLSMVLLWGLACRELTAQSPEFVGELGTAGRIVFVGQKTFTEKQLREEVGINLDLIVAGHPKAKLDRFLDVLRENIEAGYQRAGFPKVVVRSSYDPVRETVVVTIDEDVRYLCGTIEFEGAVTIDTDRIRDYLTQWQSAKLKKYKFDDASADNIPFTTVTADRLKTRPHWNVGEPASFYSPDLKQIEATIREQLQQLGYYDVKFSSKIRSEDNGTVVLVITIQDEGPQSVLGNINISGNQQNTHEDIVQFLGLVKGMRLNSDVTTDVHQKLRASGRFVEQDVKVISSPVGNKTADLKVTVYENPHAPPLKVELSPVEQASLRVGSWFEELGHSEEDLLIEARWEVAVENDIDQIPEDQRKTYSLRMVFNARRHEALLNFRFLQNPKTVLYDITVMSDRKRLSFDSGTSKVRCELPNSGFYFFGNTKILAGPPDKDGSVTRYQFGLGLGNATRGDSALRVVCDPASVFGFVRALDEALHVDKGQLVVTVGDPELRFDAKSGRLLDFFGEWDVDGKIEVNAKFAAGLYERSVAVHARDSADWDLIRIDETPFSAIVGFFAGSGKAPLANGQTQPENRLTGLAQRWRKQEQLDRVAERRDRPAAAEMSPTDSFDIPSDHHSSDGLANIYRLLLPMVGDLIPNDSWAWTIPSELAFIHLGKSSDREAVVASLLESAETGPLAHLARAYVFGFLNPKTGAEFARRGLNKLEIRDFQFDYQPFLRKDTFIGRALMRLGDLLKDCDDEEIGQFADLLPLEQGVERDAVIRSLSHFRQQHNRASLQVVPVAIDELWEPLIRPQVESLLDEFDTTATPSVPSADTWIGTMVCVKERAEAKDGDTIVDLKSIPVPAKVDEIKDDRLRLGKAWVRKSDVMTSDEALASYTEQIQLRPTDPSPWSFRGRVRRETGLIDKAIEDLSEAIRLSPTSAEFLEQRGIAWQKKGDYDAAIQDCNEAVRLSPNDAHIYIVRATNWQYKIDLDRAIADYTTALELDPKNAHALNNRGTVWTDKGEYDKAIKDLTQAIRFEPKYAGSYVNRSYVFQMTGDFESALKDLTKAIKLDPNDADTYGRRGATYHSLGDPEKALKDCSESIRLDPTNSVSFCNRGLSWEKKGEHEKAIQDQTEAIRLNPKFAEAYVGRGIVYETIGDLGHALNDFAEAIQLQPNVARPFLRRGDVYHAKGEFENAFKDYVEGVRLDPKDLPLNRRIAWIKATCPDDRFRNGREAIEYATKACKLTDWDERESLEILAAAYAESGDFKRAVKWGENAIKLASGDEKKTCIQRLKLYRANKPFRDSANKVEQ